MASHSQSPRTNILESFGIPSSSLPLPPIASHSQSFGGFFHSHQPASPPPGSPHSVTMPDGARLSTTPLPYLYLGNDSTSPSPWCSGLSRVLPRDPTLCPVFSSINLHQPGWHPYHFGSFELTTDIPTLHTGSCSTF